jgi:hypothetical protein
MAFETFDPKNLIITVNNVRVEGFAETMVSISRPNPMWTSQVGATGHVCRIKTNDFTTDVSITLQQCSLSNEAFSAIVIGDEDVNSGVFTITIVYQGETLLDSSSAYFEKMPDASWGNSPSDWEWTIKCASAVYNLSKTSQLTPNI